MAKLSASVRRHATTVLSDVKPQKLDYITDKEAEGIMALLDKWIDECESYCKWQMDLPDVMPGHHQLTAECLDSIASVKEYRSTIQSSGQSWWVLAMLSAVATERLTARLSHKSELFLKPARARLKKFQNTLDRRKWLGKRIEERALTADDLLGSGKKPKRTELFDEYHEQFDKKSKTFTADLKTIFDLAE